MSIVRFFREIISPTARDTPKVSSTLFRCSKSMILNAEKIDYVRPSLSGRFEAVMSNGEKAVVSRKYVSDLKRKLGV